MAKICKTTPRDENGRPLRIRDKESAEDFLGRFFNQATGSLSRFLTVFQSTPSSKNNSFTRFMTVNGYSSPELPLNQSNQALLKTSLADIHVLASRSAEGDYEALQSLILLKKLSDRVIALHAERFTIG